MTSLVAKKDLILATRIEEGIRKNESLESLTTENAQREFATGRTIERKKPGSNKVSYPKSMRNTTSEKSLLVFPKKSGRKIVGSRPVKPSATPKIKKALVKVSANKSPNVTSSRRESPVGKKKQRDNRRSSDMKPTSSKLSVVGFRGRSTISSKKVAMRRS